MTKTVTLLPDGRQITTHPDESILDAALRQGINLPHSCRGGSCSACKAHVTEGEISYPQGLPPGITEDEAARGEALLCQAVPIGDVTVEAREVLTEADLRIRRLPARVVSLARLNHDVIELKLKVPAVEPFDYLAGQYIDVIVDRVLRRSFSVANPPSDDGILELHVRHVPGGRFTSDVFDSMQEKALLRIEGPLGGFFLRRDSDRPILMMAGGTGWAPIKAILKHMQAEHITRPVHLFWGGRRPDDLYEHEAISQMAERYGKFFKYTPVVSEPQPGDDWDGPTGWVHEALVAAYPDLSGFEVYMSGPPAMIAAGRDAFIDHGLPGDRLFYDSFEYAADVLRAKAADAGD